MAKLYGQPGEEWGDRRVYEVMQGFSDDYYVYAQPPLIYKNIRKDPDYVIVHKKGGVIVLEVKDWVSIVRVRPTYAYVQRRFSDEPEKETSPVEQARLATFLLTDMLKESEDLLNYAGKLDFPYRFAAILPHIAALDIRKIEKV